MKTKIEFNTDAYKFSHSRNPKGTGWWMFSKKGLERVYTATGSYTEAKKKVAAQYKEEFPNDGFVTLVVLP